MFPLHLGRRRVRQSLGTLDDIADKIGQGESERTRFFAFNQGASQIRGLHEARIEGQGPQKVNVHLLGGFLAPTPAKQRTLLLTVRTDITAHVFNQANNRHPQLVAEIDGFANVRQSDLLRRGHDDRAGAGYGLGDTERFVAGPGRGINYQVIQFSQSTSAMNCLMTPCFTGPRQMTAESLSSKRHSMETTFNWSL